MKCLPITRRLRVAKNLASDSCREHRDDDYAYN
jgi:hypothetical protein